MPFQPLGGASSAMPTIQGAPTYNPMAGLTQVMQLINMFSTLENRRMQQDMNQLRMQYYQSQMENGRTEQDKKRILKERALNDYSMRLVTNPDFKKEYQDILKMSPGRQEDAFKKLKDKYIDPLRYDYDKDIISPNDVYNYLLYDKIAEARLKAKEIEDDKWSSIGKDFLASGAHLGASIANLVPGLDAQGLAKWASEYKQKAINDSLWLQDQELRRSQGEGLTDQSLSDILRTAAAGLPTALGYLGAATAGSLGGPGGMAATTGLLGASMGDIDYATRINQAPQNMQASAMQAPERLVNAVISGVTGALAPSVLRPFAAARGALNPAYRMALPTSRAAAIGRSALDSAAGMSLMGAGQQAASNLTVGSALNQDIPWNEGVLDAAVQGAILGLPMGAAFGVKAPYQPVIRQPSQPGKPTPTSQNIADVLAGKGPTNPKAGPTPESPEPPNKPPVPGSGGVSENAVTPSPDAILHNLEMLRERINKAPQDVQNFFREVLDNHKSLDDILNSPDISDNVKVAVQDYPLAESTSPQIKKVFTLAGNLKSDDKIINRLVRFFGGKDANTTLTDMLKAKAIADAAMRDAGPYGKDGKLNQALLDKAFDQALENKQLSAYGDVINYAKEQRAQAQQERASGNNIADNPANSRVAAGTPTNASTSVDGTAPEASSNSTTAQSGESNGTTPQNPGTPQANPGTGEGAGATPGEGQPGRTGENRSGSGQTNASPGEFATSTGNRADNAQSSESFGGRNTSTIDDLRARQRAANQSNAEAAKNIIEAMKLAPEHQHPGVRDVFSAAKDYYVRQENTGDAIESYNNEMRRTEQWEKMASEQRIKEVEKYLDMLDGRGEGRDATANNPSKPVCP